VAKGGTTPLADVVDINVGCILDGAATVEEVGAEIYGTT
jgi:altronate dehydratase